MVPLHLEREAHQRGGPRLVAPISGRSRSASYRSAALRSLLLNIVMVLVAITALAQPAVAASAQLEFTWEDDTSADHDGFAIERRLETAGIETYVEIGTAGPDARTYTDIDPGLLADTTYCYRLRAVTAARYSAYSSEMCGARYTLSVNKSGAGAGTVTSIPASINCGSTCTSTPFPSTTLVTLTATASAGSAFTGWSGACTGTAGCTVTMSQTRNAIATFASDPTAHTLTVSLGGSSGGSVSSNPSGIACPPACTASFTGGAAVTLSAGPDAGGGFLVWRGACTGSTASCSTTMSANRTTTAVFRKLYTNDPLVAQSTSIKAVHFTELRAAINTLRSRYGLGAYAWTDPSLTPGSTSVKRAHLVDLRTALDAAYSAGGKSHAVYADPTIITGTTPIKASHLNELRSLVRNLE
jgi:hypothetical protein